MSPNKVKLQPAGLLSKITLQAQQAAEYESCIACNSTQSAEGITFAANTAAALSPITGVMTAAPTQNTINDMAQSWHKTTPTAGL
jgi:hypothetical protein